VDSPDLGSLGFTEEKLHDVKNEIVAFGSTRDGKFLFWFERSPDGRIIPVVNGTAGASFDAFWDPFERLRRWNPFEWIPRRERAWALHMIGERESTHTFSEDGCHFAYVGTRGRRRKRTVWVVTDGIPSSDYESVETNPWFGPTGSPPVYAARVDGKSRFILNGKAQMQYEAVPGEGHAFSPDGSHVAFIARVPGGYAMVVDGTAAGPSFKRVWCGFECRVASNGRLLYMAMRDEHLARPYVLVFDGSIVTESAHLFYGGRISPDGRRFLYAEYESHRWFVDGDPLPEGTKEAEFGSDGRLYTDVDGQAFVDGAALGVPAWDYIPTFSADGQHFAWSAKAGEKYVLVRDGVRSSNEMDSIAPHLFSPDGTRLAYVAGIDGQECVIVDESQGPAFDEVLVLSLRFSADGRHLAYWAKQGGKSFMVLDQIRGQPVDDLRWPPGRSLNNVFEFSPKGQHIAAVAILGSTMRPLVDGNLGPEFMKLGHPVFQEDGAVSFFGLRGNSVYRIRASLG
jgi:hypothetical protein